ASESKWVQQLGLGIGFLFNAIKRSYIHYFAERVVFYNGPKPPHFCLRPGFRGRYIPLNQVNFKYALVASGAIPLVVAGVRNIYGAPLGVYRDGGLIDYHLTHNYAATNDDIVLFFNHQERIIPGWLDKKLSYRFPQADDLDNVLMIHPSHGFVAQLPRGKIPDRDDFTIHIDDPSTRIKNWWNVVERAQPLGEEFLELIESKKIKNVVEKIEIQ
ncbi:MAG: patatin-like phospholipase family protein, partial [Syntrophales bacterium]